jgi:outer membrane protein assembly factor BamB
LQRSRKSKARGYRPRLEILEDRTVPTAVAAPSNLISWWQAQNSPADVMGLNNATLYSGTKYAAGIVGQAFSFDGVNDRAQVADADSLKFTASMSIEGWIKVNGFPSGTNGVVHGEILFRGDDRGGLDPYSLSVEPNGTLNFLITPDNGPGVNLSAPIATGQWIHVAATLDDATGAMQLYENGALVAHLVTTARAFRDLDPGSNPSIGIGNHGGYPSTPHNLPFNGLIDELTVYDRALTSGEILGIYKAGSSGKVLSPLVVDFPSAVEGAIGMTTPITFTLTRTGSLSGPLTVNWTTADDTATAGSDYIAASGTVTFAAGQATQTVQVTANGDNTPEPDETFKLILMPAGSTPIMSLGTILNDDAGISVNNVAVTEGNTHFASLGALVDQAGNGGLSLATGMVFGPDGNLYVGSFNSSEVLRYNATTGAFLGAFVTAGSGGLQGPAVDGLIFRGDGKLYVGSRNGNSVLRYDATTGAFLDTFVTANSGGLSTVKGMVFGPDGNLYVSSAGTNQVLRYDGTTGAFLGDFVASGSGGLSNPRYLTFRPDGDLYVSSSGTNAVLRYNGTTGVFLDAFIPTSSGGLSAPGEFLFANGSVYVASQNSNQVLRYDATTGAFIEATVPANSSGLDQPIGLLLDANNNLLVGSAGANNNSQILRYGPASQAAFTVSLTPALPATVTINYSTADGTALAGMDYAAASGMLTFVPGETAKTILVSTLDNGGADPTKAFIVNLSNATGGGIITTGQGIGTILDDTKFYVVNDGSNDQTYQYAASGRALGNNALGSGDAAPRGVATTAAGTTEWVVDANKTVYVYSTGGALLGSWSAGGLTSSAQLTGIATDGTDIWLIDSSADTVYKYAGAASRLSGSQSPAGSFGLGKGKNPNTNPQDIVTDGASLWVVDGTALKVFKYTLSGSSLGSWSIDPADAHPTGITINPSNVSDIWIVDSGTLKVYQYVGAAGRTSGSQNAAATFALNPSDTNPQGIADPPPVDMLLPPPAAPVNAAPSVGPLTFAGALSLAGRDAVFALLAPHSATFAAASGTPAGPPAAPSAPAAVISLARASSPTFRSDVGSVGLLVGSSADEDSLATAMDSFFASRTDDALAED